MPLYPNLPIIIAHLVRGLLDVLLGWMSPAVRCRKARGLLEHWIYRHHRFLDCFFNAPGKAGC